jgi:hypothetical protein
LLDNFRHTPASAPSAAKKNCRLALAPRLRLAHDRVRLVIIRSTGRVVRRRMQFGGGNGGPPTPRARLQEVRPGLGPLSLRAPERAVTKRNAAGNQCSVIASRALRFADARLAFPLAEGRPPGGVRCWNRPESASPRVFGLLRWGPVTAVRTRHWLPCSCTPWGAVFDLCFKLRSRIPRHTARKCFDASLSRPITVFSSRVPLWMAVSRKRRPFSLHGS